MPAADGFRGLAIVSVMLYHISYGSGRPPLHSGVLQDLSVAGYIMPDFFFVISGFLLFLPVVLSGTFGSVRTYAIRRAARILPAYYLAIVATGLVDKAIVTNPLRDYPLWHPLGLLSLFLHLTFLQHSVGLALKLSEGFNVNGAIWTLSIEAVFYVLLPIVAVRYARHPFLGLAGALVLAALWRHASLHLQIPLPHLAGLTSKTFDRGFLVTQFPTYAADFAAGMTAAWVFVKLRRASFTIPVWVIVPVQCIAGALILRGMIAGAAADIAGTSNPYAHWTTTTLPMLCFTVLLLATAMAPLWAQVLVRNKLSRKIGDISYGMYLWHLLFVGFALTTLHWAPNATNGDWLRMAVFTFTGAILCGAASYHWIERPFIRWAKRRSAAVPQGGAGGLRPTGGIETRGAETAPVSSG
ncbi:MAG: acyltransferase family protein [Actinomycetota bacterium]